MSRLPQFGTFAARLAIHPTDISLRWRLERRVWPVSLCLILHGFLVLGAIVLYFLADAPHMLFWTGLLTFFLFIALGVVEARRSLLWLNPLSFFFFLYSLVVGAGAMNTAITYWSGSDITYVSSFLPIEDVAFGYLLSIIGYFFFHVALQLFRPPLNTERPLSREVDFKVVLAMFSLGCLAALHLDFMKWLGLFINPITYGAHAAILSVAVRPPGTKDVSRAKYWGLVLGGTALLVVVLFFRSDSKGAAVLACLPALVAVMSDRKTRKLFPMLAVPAVIVFLTVVVPTVNYSRGLRDEYPDNAQRLRAAYRDVSILRGKEDTMDFLREQGNLTLRRFFDQNLGAAFVVGEVKKSGFQEGATMDYLKTVFIPRILWPDKPVMSRGYWFSAYIGVSEYEEQGNSSTAISPAGEMYWNFGIPGVVVGLLFMGGLFGVLWRFSGANPFERTWTALAFGFTTFNITAIEADCTGVCVVLIAMLLLLGVGIGLQRMAEYRTRVLAGLR